MFKNRRWEQKRVNSLSRRFGTTLSFVVAIILIVFSFCVILYSYFELEKEFNRQLDQTVKVAKTSLQTAIWQLDYSSMNDVLSAIMLNNAIAYVRIVTDGEVAATKALPQYQKQDFDYFVRSSQFVARSVDIYRFGERVGVFQVALSRDAVRHGLILTIAEVIALAFLIISAVLFTSILISRRYIFEPLLELENSANMIAAGHLETSIDTRYHDELGRLASAFNAMTSQLKISFDTLEQKVNERTADLYDAKIAAEEANKYLAVAGAEVQALLDNSPMGILFVNKDRVIQRVNREISGITGFSATELIGKSTRILFPSLEDFQKKGEVIYSVLRKKGIFDGDLELLRKNGTKMMCHLRGRLIMLENGLEGIIWNLEDISYRLKMENELLKVKKLESIGRLAGGIAHDFNNILVAIIGNISLSERLLDNGHKAKELLKTALAASLRAKDLTVKLLTFASGGEPIKVSSSLPELLRESVSFALTGSNVKCEFDLPETIWPVNMDRGQIDQVVRNLILNAEQSMPDGGKIAVACKNIEVEDDITGLKKGRYVRVTLKDSGTGIDKANLEKIFDPYFSTKEKDSTKGSGLGLAIVHSIITKHEGLILVDSTVGKGSVFTIYLPALSEGEDIQKKGTEEILTRGKGRVLIMDDEELIRNVLSEMLSYLGYVCVQSSDGAEAVKIYLDSQNQNMPFTAVILDLTIPGGMGGKETVQKILELDSQAKVIVSSGYSHDPILDNYREHGFCYVVTKPYQILDLSRALSNVLAN